MVSPAAPTQQASGVVASAAAGMGALGTLGLFAYGVQAISALSRYFGRKRTNSKAYKTREIEDHFIEDFPVPIVYGRNRVQSQTIFRETSVISNFRAQFDMAVGLCEGEIEGVDTVYVGGRNINDTGNSSYTAYLGTATQAGDSRFAKGRWHAPCVDDATIDDSAKDTVFGDQVRLLVRNRAPEQRILIKFDLSGMPPGLILDSAEIVFVPILVEQKKTIKGYGMDDESWDEETVTWNNAPSVTDQYIADSEMKAGRDYNFAFFNDAGMTYMRTQYAAQGTVSIQLQAAEELAFIFASKESVTWAPPVLQIHYSGGDANGFHFTSYLACSIDNSDDVVQGIIPKVEATIRGLKILNWNSTDSAYETSFSVNPAWIVYDLMINGRYSVEISASDLDIDSFKTAGLYCEASVNDQNGEPEARYTCNLVIDDRGTGAQAVQDVFLTFGGFPFMSDGLIHLGVERSTASSHTILEADVIAGSFSYHRKDKKAQPNVIRGQYVDASSEFKLAFVQVEDSVDIAVRGEKVIYEQHLYGINKASQAKRICNLLLWKGKIEEHFCQFRVGLKFMDLAVGDVITLTHSVPAWSSKEFRVVKLDELGTDYLEVVAVEYADYGSQGQDNNPQTPLNYPEGTEMRNPDPPLFDTIDDWGVVGIQGGWKLAIFNYFEFAERWQVWAYSEDEEKWKFFDVIEDTRTEAGDRFSGSLVKEWSAFDPTVRTYRDFKIRAHGHQEVGEFSDTIAAWSLVRSGKIKTTPSAPTLAAPSVTNLAVDSGFAFHIDFVITAATDEEDAVRAYEIARADDNGTGDTFGSYVIVRRHEVDTDLPGPVTINVKNTDRVLKPTWKYRYRIRSIGLDGTPSAWSSYQQITLPGDTTAPAQPAAAVATTALVNVLTITGGTEADFAYFKIEGNPAAGGWQTLVAKQVLTVWVHNVTVAGIAVSWSYRVTAYDYSGNASTVSAATAGSTATLITADVIAANTVLTSNVAFTVAGTTNIIGLINASSEGGGTLKIDADHIAISGSVTFSAGWAAASNAEADIDVLNTSNAPAVAGATDDTVADTKLLSTGGAYNSAGSGARVRIFPDANTGIQVIDNASNDVFKVLVGGADVGDVIIGDYAGGQGIKFDKSSGLFDVKCKTLTFPGAYVINEDSMIGNWDIVLGPSSTIFHMEATGSAISINNNQVLTDQQAAVADATDAASVILRLNELLARVRTHGLIDT